SAGLPEPFTRIHEATPPASFVSQAFLSALAAKPTQLGRKTTALRGPPPGGVKMSVTVSSPEKPGEPPSQVASSVTSTRSPGLAKGRFVLRSALRKVVSAAGMTWQAAWLVRADTAASSNAPATRPALPGRRAVAMSSTQRSAATEIRLLGSGTIPPIAGRQDRPSRMRARSLPREIVWTFSSYALATLAGKALPSNRSVGTDGDRTRESDP